MVDLRQTDKHNNILDEFYGSKYIREITPIEDVSLFLLKSIILKMVVATKKTMFVRDREYIETRRQTKMTKYRTSWWRCCFKVMMFVSIVF